MKWLVLSDKSTWKATAATLAMECQCHLERVVISHTRSQHLSVAYCIQVLINIPEIDHIRRHNHTVKSLTSDDHRRMRIIDARFIPTRVRTFLLETS